MSNFTNFQNILTGPFREIIFFVFFGLFWCFGVSFSLSHAVSACFWHCIWHLPTPDICLTHSDTILTLPDTLRHHPDTHQTPPYLVCMRPLGESNIWIPRYLFNWSQFIWHLPTPDIYLTHSDTILKLPDTLSHHPDTPQTPPYLACMRPLGERVISEYHDIYSTVFNFPDNCLTQTSARHAQTLSRNCQTPSDTIQTPFKRPYFTVIWSYVISILLGPLVH